MFGQGHGYLEEKTKKIILSPRNLSAELRQKFTQMCVIYGCTYASECVPMSLNTRIHVLDSHILHYPLVLVAGGCREQNSLEKKHANVI